MNQTPALLESKESGLIYVFIYLLWATQEKEKVQLLDGLGRQTDRGGSKVGTEEDQEP